MDLGPDTVLLLAIWYLVFLFSTTLHEAAHALFAWKLGDPTAYHGGQVSLSPFPHIRREVLGMVVFPIGSFFLNGGTWMIGWASVPFDPRWAERHPRKSALMALAGPLANLLLLTLSGVAIWIGLAQGLFVAPERLGFASFAAATDPRFEALATLLSVGFSLNLVLFLFNLLPLPPMDGSAVITTLLPPSAAETYRTFLRQPMMMIAGLLLAWKIFGFVFWPVFSLAVHFFYPGLY